MDVVIYKLNAIIKGLKAIRQEMAEEGLLDFRGADIDALIAKARAAKLALIDFVETSEEEVDDTGEAE